MPAGPKLWTEETVTRRFEMGRGQGQGPDYDPWLRVQEFSSHGNQTRIPCPLVGRSIHTFSYLERAMFLFLEFHSIPVISPQRLGSYGLYDPSLDLKSDKEARLEDYREQFPLDRRVTMPAAKRRRIRHPRYPRTGVPMVMILDATTTYRNPSQSRFLVAWDAKPSRLLTDRRTGEKLALHRDYCDYVEIPHYIFTERSVPRNVIRNIDLVRGARPREGEAVAEDRVFESHSTAVLDRLQNACRNSPIWWVCAKYDQQHRLPPGTAIRLFYWMVWTKEVLIDLNCECLCERAASALKFPQRQGVRDASHAESHCVA
jgi:hypothetical protein